jgi:hypothetical protein
MKKKLLPLLSCFLVCQILNPTPFLCQVNSNSNWVNFSTSSVLLNSARSSSKPLQYNEDLNLVSFVQRANTTYPASPAPNATTASGVVIAKVSANWGSIWDSTCLWSDVQNAARYPQGAVYNPSGNQNSSNAYVLGTGPALSLSSAWSGNWSASKQLGSANYNTSVSAVPNATQFLPSTPPYASFGKVVYSANSFCSTDDGFLRSLAFLTHDTNPADYYGAMVLKATYNNGAFIWTGDSILPPVRYNNSGDYVIMLEPKMAWNESGTVGYVVFPGSRYGTTGSNVGIQPIVYRSTNSGNTWQLMPSIDFESQDALPIRSRLQSVNGSSGLVIPNMATSEGWDLVVDKNGKLHLACILYGAVTGMVDSLYYVRYNGSEGYNWVHQPGKRPYLYDFILSQNQSWEFGIIDSLSSEAPGINPWEPGYNQNPYGGSTTNYARVQASRTPDERFIFFTWAESDTGQTNNGLKWNTKPDLKVRVLDANTYGLSPTELVLSAGSNTNVSGKASMHFASPRSALAVLSTDSISVRLPLSVSNHPANSWSAPCTHWFSADSLKFSRNLAAFTQSLSILLVGVNETSGLNENGFEVYPNPFHSVFKLKALKQGQEKYTLELFDLSGRKLYTETVSGGDRELDMSAYASGTYILRISDEQAEVHKKIVKE